ncbi:hypothetical protein JCM10207_002679 [Rhodosporidiobolus poonsookiae]
MRVLSTLLLVSSAASLSALAAPARLDTLDVAEVDYASSSQLYELSEVEKRDLEERAVSGIITQCKSKDHFALTFDDGDYTYGTTIADYLTSKKVKGTFFVNGNNWACLYDRANDLIKRYKQGHVIGSHTWSHPDISKLTDAQLNKQLDLVETALKKILGVVPRLFRAPYGSISSANVKVLQKRGYTIVGWNFDSNDANGRAPLDSVSDYKKLKTGSSYIALNHETKEGTAKTVMPQVVPYLQSKGWKLVDVATCLGVSPYQSVGTAGKRDKTWTCAGTLQPGQA